jgi:hypothetical protein
MYVHALHTAHALPDLRIAGGRSGDAFFKIFACRVYVIRIHVVDNMGAAQDRGRI